LKQTNPSMIKLQCLAIIVAISVLASCSNSSPDNTQVDSTKNKTGKNVLDNGSNISGKSNSSFKNKKDQTDILVNIDKYLVSKPVYTIVEPNGGIINASVTARNSLNDVTFEKAIIEVNILMADGTEYRTDYYTLLNIEPGLSKTVSIPNTTKGTIVESHIVKVMSTQLTNGEFILVGMHYVPK